MLTVGGMIMARNLGAFALKTDGGYLRSLGELGEKTWFRVGFFMHVMAAGPMLVVGWLQFWNGLRERAVNIHRWLGRLYVVLILVAAAPGGIVLAMGAEGGIPGKICFVLMSVLWFFFSLRAYIRIKQGEVQGHKNDMLRSYVLAFGAVTLRLWMFLIGGLLEFRSPGAYALCAWISWVPNIVLTELWIRNDSPLPPATETFPGSGN